MINKSTSNDIVWVDKDKNIFNENYTVKVMFLGITIFKKTTKINHNMPVNDTANKMGFGK